MAVLASYEPSAQSFTYSHLSTLFALGLLKPARWSTSIRRRVISAFDIEGVISATKIGVLGVVDCLLIRTPPVDSTPFR